MDIFKQGRKDTVLMLRKYEGVYKFEKKFKVSPGEEYNYQGKRYMPPTSSNWIEKSGCFLHIVDANTGMGIPLMGSMNVAFTAKQIDSYVADNMVKNFVKSFGSAVQQDKMLVLTLLGSGLGIGLLIGWIIMVVGAG